MNAQTILSLMARRQVDRFLRAKKPIRHRLGNNVDMFSFQERLLGTLILSPSMGPILYEAGRRVALEATREAVTTVSRLPGYRRFVDAEGLEEARVSTEFTLLQLVYKSTGTGILQLSQYEKDKLMVFQVEECAECFALPDIGKSVCYYTAGDLAGSMEAILGRRAGFVESKCLAEGDQLCEYRSNLKMEAEEGER
jgi:predicted hydrocarbon binding protein